MYQKWGEKVLKVCPSIHSLVQVRRVDVIDCHGHGFFIKLFPLILALIALPS